jgi:hypothetical protein
MGCDLLDAARAVVPIAEDNRSVMAKNNKCHFNGLSQEAVLF